MADLLFNQIPIRDDNHFLCLTDMWKAAGGVDAKRPSDWRALPATCDFIEYIQESGNAGFSGIALIRSERGGKNPGTWAHWHLALAYAKYLSPEFHVWCNTVVRDYMEGRLVPATQQTSLALQSQQLSELVSDARAAFKSIGDLTASVNLLIQRIPVPETSSFVSRIQLRLLRQEAAKVDPKGHASPVWKEVRQTFGYKYQSPVFGSVPASAFEDVLAFVRATPKRRESENANVLPFTGAKVERISEQELAKQLSEVFAKHGLSRTVAPWHLEDILEATPNAPKVDLGPTGPGKLTSRARPRGAPLYTTAHYDHLIAYWSPRLKPLRALLLGLSAEREKSKS